MAALNSDHLRLVVLHETKRLLPLRALVSSDIAIFTPPRSYPEALEMVASGKVDVKPLVTHTYKLEESIAAFEQAKTGEGGAIKIMIRCGTDEGR